MRIQVYAPDLDLAAIRGLKVSYQAAQFCHLREFADVVYSTDLNQLPSCQALVVHDELTLLTDPKLARLELPADKLFVFVTHDYWCHPLKVADVMRRQKRALMVLRHHSAINLFNVLLPAVPKVLLRPGVETSIFHPYDGRKTHDILLGGSETPDYPLRQRFNRIVREYRAQYQWTVLDQTGVGLGSNPPGTQMEYSRALAACRVSPTATNRGGSAGAKLALQYFDLSPARAQMDHPFYGLLSPEVSVLELQTAGITPRYLESLACKTLLMGDLPPEDAQEWYRDKMVVLDPSLDDATLAATIEHWVRDAAARTELVERAHREVVRTESSRETARVLADTLKRHRLET